MAKSLFNGSNVTIMVSSMAKSVKFYTETLGMPLIVRHSSHWAEVNAGGMTIGLHPKIKTKKIKQGDNMSIGLSVKDIEKAMKDLEKKGIVFEYKKDSMVKMAHFNDPDDNLLYLFEQKK